MNTTTLRSELIKLRTSRATLGLLAAGILYAVLNGVATAGLAGSDGNAPLGSAGNVAGILRAGNIGTWVVLLVGLLALTSEYRHRTITTTYLATPRRGAVVRAKMLVVGVLAAAYSVALMAAGIVAALPELIGSDAHVDVVDGHTARVVGGMITATVLFGIAGVGVGGLIRNQTAATVGAIAWLVAAENIVGSALSWRIARWFPGRAAEAASGGGADILLPMGAGAALFACYALTATVLATRLALRRDVT